MILSHLNARSLLNMAQACKEMKDICREGLLWRRLYLKDFGSKFGKFIHILLFLKGLFFGTFTPATANSTWLNHISHRKYKLCICEHRHLNQWIVFLLHSTFSEVTDKYVSIRMVWYQKIKLPINFTSHLFQEEVTVILIRTGIRQVLDFLYSETHVFSKVGKRVSSFVQWKLFNQKYSSDRKMS